MSGVRLVRPRLYVLYGKHSVLFGDVLGLKASYVHLIPEDIVSTAIDENDFCVLHRTAVVINDRHFQRHATPERDSRSSGIILRNRNGANRRSELAMYYRQLVGPRANAFEGRLSTRARERQVRSCHQLARLVA